MKKFLSFFPFLIILIFAFIVRWYAISSVAPGISTDEIDYSLNAKSFYLTGEDLGGKIHTLDVFRFHYPATDSVKAELPYILQMPFVGPFPFSLPVARLPYILMSVGMVFLIFLITKKLFDEKVGVVASIISAINPFLIVLGRTSYEVVPATFFFLLALWLILHVKGRSILIVFPVFLAAFYAYIGTKLVFLPFIIIVSFFCYFFLRKKEDGKYYLALVLLSFAFVIFYFLSLRINSKVSRLDQLLTPSSPVITSIVNSTRNGSISSFLGKIVVNKPVVYIQAITQNFFTSFSTDFLLITGDGFFRLYNHGVIYYLDYIFIIIGFVNLFKKKNKTSFLILALLFASVIPQVFYNAVGSSPNYSHSVLIFPILAIITGFGIVSFINIIPTGIYRNLIIFSVIILYVLSFTVFLQVYFYQYPLHGKDDYPTRLLSKYVSLAEAENKHVIIMSPVSVEHFKKYIFYSNSLNKTTILSVKNAFETGNIKLGNVSFTSCPLKPVFTKGTIFIEDVICGDKDFMQHSSIPLILDGGVAYKIYQDSICSGYTLKRYPYNLSLSDINVENLSKPNFCEDFITR